ncbi:MAG: hypothetical protein R6U96_04140, partial [Promethearchaeia archaeon]
DTTYNFTIEDATGDVNASIWDQNEDMLTSSTDSLSFNATKDTNYFLVLDPDDPCTTNVSFGGICWPGKNPTYAKLMNIPYGGDYANIQEGESVWYSFDANSGDQISFWLYEFNEADNLDLTLYDSSESEISDVNIIENNTNKTLTTNLDSSGRYYLEVNGSSVVSGEGDYKLDFGYSVSEEGTSSGTPIDFDTSTVEGNLRGAEVETKGGVWYSIECEEKKEYSFTFNGDASALYDYELVDSDGITVISRKTFSGSPSTLDYKCLSAGEKYIHILPYKGGVNYSISKDVQPFDHVGESSESAQPFSENFPLQSNLPTGWGSSTYWDEISLEKDTKLLLKLDYDDSTNFDLYLYDQQGSEVLDSSYQKNPEIISYDISDSGNYKVLVDGIEGSGQYTLTAAPATKLSTGEISGEFAPSSLNEYHYVHLKKGETLEIDLESSGFRSPYFGVYLYDQEFSEVGKDVEGTKIMLEYTAEEEGDYYIRFCNSEMGNGDYSGTINIRPPDITVLYTILAAIVIPLVFGLTFMAVSTRYKKKHGEWFWKDSEFREKLYDMKFNSKRKLREVRKDISEKYENFKDKSSSTMGNAKKKVSRKISDLKAGTKRTETSADLFDFPDKTESFSESPEFSFEEDEELDDGALDNLKDLVDSDYKVSFEEKEKLSEKELENLRNLIDSDED